MKEIVSAEWLNENLDNPDLVILDASIDSSIEGKHSELAKVTIPKSKLFDLKGVFLDKSSPFPNTIPNEKYFEAECRKLGINKDSKIVVFDNFGIYSSPRVWWMFNVMGHSEIAVLDGGLPNWDKKGFPIQNKFSKKFEPGNFKSNYQDKLVVGFEEIEQNSKNKNFLIVDARSKGRFDGVENEPRKHLKSGNIPNSVNLPYQEVLDEGKFKKEKDLRALFEKRCSKNQELVFSCGSGLTACIIMLASEIAFKKDKRVYDGSWTEWAELKNLKNKI